MPKSEVEQETERVVSQGGILAKLYFDMQSEKAEELQPIMADLINNRLLKTPGVAYCFGAIDEPIKLDKEYSTSAAVTVLFKDIFALLSVSFTFAPAGVEIIKPERQYVLKQGDLQALALNLAQVSVDYSNYILGKVLKDEDLERVRKELKSREDLGKRLLDSKKKVEEKK